MLFLCRYIYYSADNANHQHCLPCRCALTPILCFRKYGDESTYDDAFIHSTSVRFCSKVASTASMHCCWQIYLQYYQLDRPVTYIIFLIKKLFKCHLFRAFYLDSTCIFLFASVYPITTHVFLTKISNAELSNNRAPIFKIRNYLMNRNKFGYEKNVSKKYFFLKL